MQDIAASILGKDNKKELVNLLIKNNINQIHYDVMDGKFVENISLPIIEVLDIISNTDEHVSDVHLMTYDPINQIDIIDGKVDWITFHYEAVSKQDFNKILKNRKSKIGISIKPDTNIEDIKYLLDDISHVLIMSVEPGKGGQTFIESSLEKIIYLRTLKPNMVIQVDGGINDKWGPKCFEAGANSVVSGSFLINNLSSSVRKLFK